MKRKLRNHHNLSRDGASLLPQGLCKEVPPFPGFSRSLESGGSSGVRSHRTINGDRCSLSIPIPQPPPKLLGDLDFMTQPARDNK